MSMDSVNNTSNAGLVAAATGVGAAAGAGAAYLQKSYLKDGIPTDEFLKKFDDKCIETLPPEQQAAMKEAKAALKKWGDDLLGVKSVDEFKSILMKNSFPEGASVDMVKEMFVNSGQITGMSPDKMGKIMAAENIDDLKKFASELIDEQYAGKNIDEIKTAIKSEADAFKKKMSNELMSQYWDSTKKVFKNCEEGMGKAFKEAAKSVQGKYALIYGAIGAGVAGLTALAMSGSNKTPEN